MKTTLSMLALVVGLGLAGAAFAQDTPSGGPTAKGNAPIKQTHTINDGAAKPGANSFTQNEARKHILNSGYSSVSGLAKGKDGVWRGTAMKGDASVNVALDFKGNVSEGGPAGAASTMTTPTTATTATTTTTATTPTTPTTGATPMTASTSMHHHHHWRHHHRMHHHMRTHCTSAKASGAACSGVDRNRDGIADKDEHKSH